MLIPIVLVTAIAIPVVNAWRKPKRAGLTGRRAAIFESALVTMKKPDDLRTLATAFEGEGLIPEADLLRKRAALRELPKETRKQRRAIFSKAIKSSNIEAIRKVADAFRSEGCTGAAATLYAHADTLVEEAEKLDVPIEDTATLDENSEDDGCVEPEDEADDSESTENAADETGDEDEDDEREAESDAASENDA
jgi:hypothetical protein